MYLGQLAQNSHSRADKCSYHLDQGGWMQPASHDWPQECSASKAVPESYLGGCLGLCWVHANCFTVQLILFLFHRPAPGSLITNVDVSCLTAYSVIPENNATQCWILAESLAQALLSFLKKPRLYILTKYKARGKGRHSWRDERVKRKREIVLQLSLRDRGAWAPEA